MKWRYIYWKETVILCWYFFFFISRQFSENLNRFYVTFLRFKDETSFQLHARENLFSRFQWYWYQRHLAYIYTTNKWDILDIWRHGFKRHRSKSSNGRPLTSMWRSELYVLQNGFLSLAVNEHYLFCSLNWRISLYSYKHLKKLKCHYPLYIFFCTRVQSGQYIDT